MSDQATRY